MKRAVIDIGTNTTHLLIANVTNGSLRKVHCKRRYYTFLGEGGLESIGDAALSRLWDALDDFKKTIDQEDVIQTQVIATEGLRSACNGQKTYDRIKEKYDWGIDIISGNEESEMIYQGVKLSLDMTIGSYLIMDIGGGSVEFIWVKDGDKLYQDSYPIGISRLYEKFHESDPIENVQLQLMYDYIVRSLKKLWQALGENLKMTQLVGCAGTFEIFLDESHEKDNTISTSVISLTKFRRLFKEVIQADLSKRQLVKGLPVERAQYIVVALGLIKVVLDRIGQEQFVVSKMAIKEGVIVSNKYFLD